MSLGVDILQPDNEDRQAIDARADEARDCLALSDFGCTVQTASSGFRVLSVDDDSEGL